MANPVGEANWAAYLEESVRNATDLERRVNAIELYKRALSSEPNSLRLWLGYCEYFWSLWSDSQSEASGQDEEEKLMARELFTFDAARELWQQGYDAVKTRINDSHLLWDRWIELEMDLFHKSKSVDDVQRISELYKDRLMTPHLTWEETSQRFSSFLSEFDQAAWEDSMKQITSSAQAVKRLVAKRESFELKLKQAARSGDPEAERTILRQYLDWESSQNKIPMSNRPNNYIDFAVALHARAVTDTLATDEAAWARYVALLSSESTEETLQILFDALRRAVEHCPWSGKLWNRYIGCAEEIHLAFEEVEAIKQAAINHDDLYKNGMDSMIEMYVAWCGYLRRHALGAHDTDESKKGVEAEMRAALQNVTEVGRRMYNKDFRGDPKFRLEQIQVRFLTDSNALEAARGLWKKLSKNPLYADSHDFWLRYYNWEMSAFLSADTLSTGADTRTGPESRHPAMASAVLVQATSRNALDWPEKILEVYLQHCNDYEDPSTIRKAVDVVGKAEERVRKRREKEQQDQAAYAEYYAAQESAQEPKSAAGADTSAAVIEEGRAEDSPSGSKRKRDSAGDVAAQAGSATKRQRSEATSNQPDPSTAAQNGANRDRENATVVVTNLPAGVTQPKLKHYFKEYGRIKSITALVQEDETNSSTALIEFGSADDAHSALLRDGKYFDQSQISVQSGHDLTIYLANFPPAADDGFIKKLFKEAGSILSIRWPSLKVNTHRRFCYVSFRNRESSAKAVQKDGTLLEGKFKLIAKYSDPGHKKRREGAVAEGREVHVTNLDRAVTEAELRDVFEKAGKVTRVNIPQTMAGVNKGFAFLDFETKEQAQTAAAELNNVKLHRQIINVEVSKENKVKPSARILHSSRDSASPAPSAQDAEGDHPMGSEQDASASGLSRSEVEARTVALLGLPDTVNDARVQNLAEGFGKVVKLVLQPAHGSARIEFEDVATAGKAGMVLNGYEFEGHKLRTGSLDDLRRPKTVADGERKSHGSADHKSSASSTGPKNFMMPNSVRRPVLKQGAPRRGAAPMRTAQATSGESASANDGPSKPKSNADFKAMFLSKGEQAGDNGAQKGSKEADGKNAS